MPKDTPGLGSAIAGGAIAMALIEALLDKGVLTLDEARGVLDGALRLIGPFMSTDGGTEAAHIIARLGALRFTER